MNNGGDAAEQIVRLSLEGFEVAVRLTGSAAKNIAILLASVLKQGTEGLFVPAERPAEVYRTGKTIRRPLLRSA